MISSSAPSSPLHVCFAEFELDEANARLLRKASAIALAPTPFALLCALVRRPGALLTKHALLDEVWGHRFVSDSVLKGTISDLRTVLDDDPREPRFIETVPRRGYRFIATSMSVPEAPVHAGNAGDIRPEVQVTGQGPALLGASELGVRQIAFVGRAKEVALLRRAWDRVGSGRRVVFWIAGEPGIGKTTLIDSFVSGVGDIALARGHCVQHYGSGEPYHPILEALAELCRSDAKPEPLLRSVAPTWLLQLPWLNTAEQREALLRELVGVNLGTHAPRNGGIFRPLHGQSTTATGDGGPSLGRSCDRAAHRLSRSAPRQWPPHVAFELQARRGRRLGASAQRIASRAPPAWPLRGDCARFLLGRGGGGVRGGALTVVGE